ncbi:MAG: twin-arginine translocation signal domain-containing protein, partial [Dehalococcoidia bacterium]
MLLRQQISRRRFLGVTAMAAAATTLASACELPLTWPATGRLPHLAWVWHFGVDGPPERIASVLAQNKVGIILKAFNGTQWMSTWDTTRYAITGPDQVAALAKYFENNGVPFHTYGVVQGLDPQREADMCAQVIGAGARSV